MPSSTKLFSPKYGVVANGEFIAGGQEIPESVSLEHLDRLMKVGAHSDELKAQQHRLQAPALSKAQREPKPKRGDKSKKKPRPKTEPRLGKDIPPAYTDTPLESPRSIRNLKQQQEPTSPQEARSWLPAALADPSILTDEEVMYLTPKKAKELTRHFNKLRPLREYTVAAKLGLAKRGWYKKAAKVIADLFGKESPRFAAVLAATSPQNSVQDNLRDSLVIWSNFNRWLEERAAQGKHERPDYKEIAAWFPTQQRRKSHPEFDSELHTKPMLSHTNNVIRALAADNPGDTGFGVLSGPKVDSFRRNLFGYLLSATIDVWEARKARFDQNTIAGDTDARTGLKGPNVEYLASTAKLRMTAGKLNEERFASEEEWTTAEVQETGWSLFRALAYVMGHSVRQARKGRGAPINAHEALNSLTHEVVGTNSDFATLLVTDKHARRLLKRLGLDGALAKLDKEHEKRQATETTPLTGRVASSLQDPRDLDAARAIASEAARYQTAFTSPTAKYRRRGVKRYAESEPAPLDIGAHMDRFNFLHGYRGEKRTHQYRWVHPLIHAHANLEYYNRYEEATKSKRQGQYQLLNSLAGNSHTLGKHVSVMARAALHGDLNVMRILADSVEDTGRGGSANRLREYADDLEAFRPRWYFQGTADQGRMRQRDAMNFEYARAHLVGRPRIAGEDFSKVSPLRKSRKRRRYAAAPSVPLAPTNTPPASSVTSAPQNDLGDGGYVASSSETDTSLDFAQAYQRAISGQGKAWKQTTEMILKQLGLSEGSKSHIGVGDWEGSAEHSVLNILPGPPHPDLSRLAAAWYGLISNQKAVLHFHADHSGPDSTYQIHVPSTNIKQVRAVLDHYGVKNRTIIPDAKGTKVVYFDQGRADRDKVAAFASHYNAPIHEALGRGEFIGGPSRSAARRAYREIIRAAEQVRGSKAAGPRLGSKLLASRSANGTVPHRSTVRAKGKALRHDRVRPAA